MSRRNRETEQSWDRVLTGVVATLANGDIPPYRHPGPTSIRRITARIPPRRQPRPPGLGTIRTRADLPHRPGPLRPPPDRTPTGPPASLPALQGYEQGWSGDPHPAPRRYDRGRHASPHPASQGYHQGRPADPLPTGHDPYRADGPHPASQGYHQGRPADPLPTEQDAYRARDPYLAPQGYEQYRTADPHPGPPGYHRGRSGDPLADSPGHDQGWLGDPHQASQGSAQDLAADPHLAPHGYDRSRLTDPYPAPHGYDGGWSGDPHPGLPHDDQGRADNGTGHEAARAACAPASEPADQFGLQEKTLHDPGYQADSWAAAGTDPRRWPDHGSFEPPEYGSSERTEHGSFELPGAAGGTDLPDGPYDTQWAEPWDRQDAAPRTPPWLRTPGERPTAAGPGYLEYLDAGRGSQPDVLENFPPPGRRRGNRLLATAAVLAAALVAAAAVFITRHPGGRSGRTPSPAAAGSRVTGASPTARNAKSAGSAPSGRNQASQGQISAGQVFAHGQVVADGIRFHRVTGVLTQECSAATRGVFTAALKSAGCQRVIRATFVDSAKRYAVTAGVAELPSPAAASSADRSRKFGQDVWFTGLDGPAKSGATAVSTSVGVGYDTVDSRYIVYALATNSDGRNPTSHTTQVRTLKALARSFTAVTLQPLARSPKQAPTDS